MKKKAAVRALSIAALVISLILFALYWPIGVKETPPEDYIPFQEDDLALRYCPVFESPSSFEPVVAIYYRAARDREGNIHMAFHPVWKREINRYSGWGAFLSRSIYTGGLSLQRIMFGKGDVESIGVTIDPQGDVVVLEYETAKDYHPDSFSVTHFPIREEGKVSLPLRFRVISWNHLFSRKGNEASAKIMAGITGTEAGTMPETYETFDAEGADVPSARSVPFGYFSAKLWSDYAMWKNPETILRKNRSHFVWERGTTR